MTNEDDLQREGYRELGTRKLRPYKWYDNDWCWRACAGLGWSSEFILPDAWHEYMQHFNGKRFISRKKAENAVARAYLGYKMLCTKEKQ